MKTKEYKADGLDISTRSLEIQARESIDICMDELKIIREALRDTEVLIDKIEERKIRYLLKLSAR